jgi:GNAT superfamily N-acetyltransferase
LVTKNTARFVHPRHHHVDGGAMMPSVNSVSGAGVAIRPASGADAAAIMAIWAANGDEIPEGGVDILTPYLAHLMGTGRVLVAEHAGEAVGFGAVLERAGVVHLADLFVLPDRFGEGIGGQLLTAVFGDAPLRTTFASSDPRALPLYVRAGMSPLWPNLYLDVDSSSLPPVSSTMRCEPADATRLAQLEQRWLGHTKPGDHRFWASLPGARPFVVLERGQPVAAVHARCRRTGRDRWINRVVMAPDSDPTAVLVAAYHHAGEGGRIGSCLPGPSPALRTLLHARARILDQDTFMASDPTLFDPTRRISDGGIL